MKRINTTKKKKNCFINNQDWEVTKEIYSNSVVEDGVIDIKMSLHDCIGLRRVQCGGRSGGAGPGAEAGAGAVCGEVPLVYEYGILSECLQAPIIRLSFQYTNTNGDDDDGNDNDDEENEYMLDAVRIDVRYDDDYTKEELTSSHYCHPHGNDDDKTKSDDITTIHSKWLKWLQSNANDLLEETQLSFSICDFIEHQAITYFNIIHKDDALGYTAILFDDQKVANDYNIIRAPDGNSSTDLANGTSTPASFAGVQLVLHSSSSSSSSSSSWKNSKTYTTTYQPKKRMTQQSTTTKTPSSHFTLDDYAIRTIQNHWKEWVYFECPICFDKFKCDSEGVELPCRHLFCGECIELYIQSICSELHLFRQSPFICPVVSCKMAMKIRSCDYPISKENVDAINMWKYDLKYPKTNVLSTCPRKSCRSKDMRKASSDLGETMVFCSTCQKAYCEICLNKYEDKECKNEHAFHNCDERPALRLCRRYRNASSEIKLKADERWHWLKEYASARDDDITAKLWINENACACPRCRTGIERIEGCFHMHCTLCGTHFCYECGEELFYPYYGTHHCWEEGRAFDDFG